jgi:hypothetical protein
MTVLLFVGASWAGELTTYGDPLSDAEPVRIGELVSNPERYVDKKIKIEGLVDDVCPMKGCWVDILDAQSRETIRFKVQDDVIVFPVEAKGSEVVAEGVLRKHELSRERAVAWMRHLAAEKGEAFDETTVTGPMNFYQIEGLGAVVRIAG